MGGAISTALEVHSAIAEGLSDDLARPKPAGHAERGAKSPEEFAQFLKLQDEKIVPVFESRSAFLDFLLHAHDGLEDVPSGFRNHEVHSKPTTDGSHARFVPLAEAPAALDRLREFIRCHWQEHPAFASAVLLNGICQVHPFADGNGRTSRILFNWFSAQYSGSARYVPLHEIASARPGVQIIKMNRARFNGDWAPFLRYLIACVRLTDLLEARFHAL